MEVAPQQGGVLVFDIEATKIPTFHPWQQGAKLCSLGMITPEGKYKVWLFEHDTERIRSHKDMIAEIKQEFAKAHTIVAHNLKFDIHWLWHIGVGTEDKQLHCTQVSDYLLNGQRKIGYSLNAVADRYGLGQKEDMMKEWWDNGYNTPQIPLNIHLPYLKQDVELTKQIYDIQKSRTAEHSLENITRVSMELLNILAGMEYRGFPFNKGTAIHYLNEYISEREELDQSIQNIVGTTFSVSSGPQLSAALYGGTLKREERVYRQVLLKSGSVRTRSRIEDVTYPIDGLGINPLPNSETAREGTYKTDKDTLAQLKPRNKKQEEALDLLKQYAKVKKVISTLQSDTDSTKGLINLVQPSGRVHPNFNQTVTATGRLSSSNPNAQNLPRGGTSPIKECIQPTLSEIINVDLAQVEFRVAAVLSQDKVMLKEIREGLDTHADNAIRFFGAKRGAENFKKLRTIAKVFTFRLLYGGSAYAFFMDPNMPNYTLQEWEAIVKAYYDKYKGLKAWQEKNVEFVMKHGYLRNPSGRILGFTKVKSDKDGSWGFKRNQILNYPVQSAASDLMYIAMIEIAKRVKAAGIQAIPLLQVHDSMVFDCRREDRDTLCEISIAVFESLPDLADKYYGWKINVPLTGDCEVGPNYRESKLYAKCACCKDVWFFPTKENEVSADVYWCDTCLKDK